MRINRKLKIMGFLIECVNLCDVIFFFSLFRYLQRPGAKFSLAQIQNWAKRPLPGNDLHLVNKAFYNFGGWLNDTISSTRKALNSGWGINLSFDR